MGHAEVITALLSFFGGAGALGAVAAVVGYLLVSRLLLRDMEEFKAELAHELERVKHDLQATARKEEALFVLRHGQRVEVLPAADLLVNQAVELLGAVVRELDRGSWKPVEEQLPTIVEKSREFLRRFNAARIYFPQATADSLDELCFKIEHTRALVSKAVIALKSTAAGVDAPGPTTVAEARVAFESMVLPARDRAESALRSLLGVTERLQREQ